MPTLRSLILSTFALAALLGCEKEAKPPVDLALACQLTDCICKGSDGTLFKKPSEVPPLWTERGHAYCAEGFTLEMVEKK